MTLGLELWDEPKTSRCCDCGGDRVLFRGVHEGETTIAVFGAWLYHHGEAHEVFIDAILGTWGDDLVRDHVTFGARTGPVDGQSAPASTLVTGGPWPPTIRCTGGSSPEMMRSCTHGSPASGRSTT